MAERDRPSLRRADAALHAFLHVAEPSGERPGGPLADLSVAVKDNLCTRDMPTTCGSRILEGYRPPYDATAVDRLRRAGADLVGKTNLDEFAMGSSTENSAFGPTRNPWDRQRVPGGSSGGSAAAVAAGLVDAALGSDTGGSVRQPAAYCGVVGLKPTYGRVSRYGLVAFASSLDQVGVLAADVRTTARVYDAVAGPDAHDATSAAVAVEEATAALAGAAGARGLRLGLVREGLGPGVDDEVAEAVEAAVRALAAAGATLSEVSLPHAPRGLSTYYLVAMAEASSNLARYDGIRYGRRAAAPAAEAATAMAAARGEGFGAEVKRRIVLGTYVLSAGYYDAYYRTAQRVRTLVAQDFDQAFREVDLLALPTAPNVAFPLGERLDDPLKMYAVDLLTVPASLAGLPAVSVPAPVATGRLPVGLQLIGPAFSEALLLRAAAALEEVAPWPPHPPARGQSE